VLIGDIMLTLFDHVFLRELVAECGRLLLISAAAAYVGANVRRLAARYGWDSHLLGLSQLLAIARQWPRNDGWIWLTYGAAGGATFTLMLLIAL
jgi:hypothetical protein